ncbi:hypothetical protein HY469_05855 [Candidatus Roizmanbacteria bacterium]|nr:hypothetical protein [Candidatus Roizmanbacteria bacterium]
MQSARVIFENRLPSARNGKEISRAETKRLKDLMSKSDRIIFKTRSVFPFDLFPDEIIIDETKVSIITHSFFETAQVRSIGFNDIFNVILEYSIFFAKIKVIEVAFLNQPLEVEYLKKSDALRARRIIQGLIIAKKEGIDFGKILPSELVKRTEEVGKARE